MHEGVVILVVAFTDAVYQKERKAKAKEVSMSERPAQKLDRSAPHGRRAEAKGSEGKKTRTQVTNLLMTEDSHCKAAQTAPSHRISSMRGVCGTRCAPS